MFKKISALLAFGIIIFANTLVTTIATESTEIENEPQISALCPTPSSCPIVSNDDLDPIKFLKADSMEPPKSSMIYISIGRFINTIFLGICILVILISGLIAVVLTIKNKKLAVGSLITFGFGIGLFLISQIISSILQVLGSL